MARGQQTKNKIIQIALEQINVKGYESTSVDEIIQAAGITKGAFYHHFSSKESLLLETLNHLELEFVKFLDEHLNNNNPQQALKNFFKAALKTNTQKKFIGGCPLGNLALEKSDCPNNLAIKDKLKEIFTIWNKKLQATIEAGQQQNLVTDACHAAELSSQIIAAIEGGIMLSRLFKTDRHLKSATKLLSKFLFK
jgi:TetR/AcrR family transcriptional repressor of nem operon